MKICLPKRKSYDTSSSAVMKWVLFTFFNLFSFCLFAQTNVSGRVTAGDTALSGVTVLVKGTDKATSTNANGDFTISAPSNATLVFTSIGFARRK